MAASNIIGIPADPKSFEENCVVLFAGLLRDPNVKLVGTTGKSQSGIDIIGKRNRDPSQIVGIQCKLISRGGKLAEKDIRKEAKMALTITPPLNEFFIVTTARDDLEYDKIATIIAQEQAKLGRIIDMQIWGWDTLEPKIRADKSALDAFDPGHSASTDRIIEMGEETFAGQQRMQESSGLSTLSLGDWASPKKRRAQWSHFRSCLPWQNQSWQRLHRALCFCLVRTGNLTPLVDSATNADNGSTRRD